MKTKQIIALLNEAANRFDQQFLDSGGGVSEAHIPHQSCALPPSTPPEYDLLLSFYHQWLKCETRLGCYALMSPHDYRCAKITKASLICSCGRDELEKINNLIMLDIKEK